MKLLQKTLLEDLTKQTKDNLEQAKDLQNFTIKALNWKANPESWSILECIEHLNRYGDFYLPEIQQRIDKANKITIDPTFKSGFLGNYFAKSMLPKEQLNKMKTFKSMNPVGSDLDQSALEKFITQQTKTLDLLEQAKSVNLNKVKTSISISRLIKLKLGDTLRVVIYHNQRHLLQANKAIKQMQTVVD